jgi:hypothetical protein
MGKNVNVDEELIADGSKEYANTVKSEFVKKLNFYSKGKKLFLYIIFSSTFLFLFFYLFNFMALQRYIFVSMAFFIVIMLASYSYMDSKYNKEILEEFMVVYGFNKHKK